MTFTGIDTISFIVFCAVFFATIALFVVADLKISEKSNLKKKKKAPQDEWLFDKWAQKLYSAFFKDKDPAPIAKKIGLDAPKYLHNCEIAGVKPDLQGVIIKKLTGLLLCFVTVVVAAVFKNLYIGVIGILLGLFVYYFCTYKAEKLAKEKKDKIIEELPRFTDMLQMALSINIPVERAIIITAKYLPNTILAEEFINSASEMEIGAIAWQETLEHVAMKYEIDDLSDFVLSIVTAYDKGVPIYATVSQKALELKQKRTLEMRERAGKLNGQILLPIAIFKLIPLIAIMCIPIIAQLKSNGL